MARNGKKCKIVGGLLGIIALVSCSITPDNGNVETKVATYQERAMNKLLDLVDQQKVTMSWLPEGNTLNSRGESRGIQPFTFSFTSWEDSFAFQSYLEELGLEVFGSDYPDFIQKMEATYEIPDSRTIGTNSWLKADAGWFWAVFAAHKWSATYASNNSVVNYLYAEMQTTDLNYKPQTLIDQRNNSKRAFIDIWFGGIPANVSEVYKTRHQGKNSDTRYLQWNGPYGNSWTTTWN